MKLSNRFFMMGLMILGTLSMTACSSGKVGEEELVESAESGDLDTAEASTDVVPDAEASLNSGELASASTEQSPSDAPVADASQVAPSDVPVQESAVADASAENASGVADAPLADTSANAAADVPVSGSEAIVPLTDNVVSSENQDSAPVEVAPVKKAKKGKKSKSGYAKKAAPTGPASEYQVKAGDTLMKIAFEQYGDLYRWKEIYHANRDAIKDPNSVPPGTVLNLNGAGMVTIERNGESYLIKRGDTLGVISNDVYGTARKWKKLWENNRQLIKDPNKIYAGFYLYYIPEGKLTREEAAPGLKSDDSAMNAPVVGAAPRAPASEQVPAQNNPAKN